MTTEDLQRLERSLGRPLSPAVRQFFLNFPPELRARAEEHDPDGYDDFVLTDDVDELIAMNDPAQSYVLPLDWAPHMFILGAGGCGETYWVDLDDEQGSVHRFEAGQEAEYSDPVADSLEELARGMLGGDPDA